ncbi:helix-turn-helix transcriptional regulator [Rivularia sp. UHCC 0363]|uniref:helix-turn-helix domain-containing protein n=1 Tax=Rivularia sp. UHCC 0363 TaxID=3110244 RepID=UPI002B2212B3|nr:helix-turn-helix transcriptional regulator [Rivularia sp. UHCC 0363]MEA5595720.1 helix-turn-helix transcriptional regulator [Rivularia sp. UHCC 0363]
MNFNQAFDSTLKDFGVSAKRLAEQSGVTPQSISEFRREKKSIQTDSLEKLLEFLPVEAKVHFFNLFLGEKILLEHLIAKMDRDQMSDIMMAIANNLKTNREESNGNNTNQDSIKKTLLMS